MTWTRDKAVSEWKKASSSPFLGRSSLLKAVDDGLAYFCKTGSPDLLTTAYANWRWSKGGRLSQRDAAEKQLIAFMRSQNVDLECYWVRKLLHEMRYTDILHSYPLKSSTTGSGILTTEYNGDAAGAGQPKYNLYINRQVFTCAGISLQSSQNVPVHQVPNVNTDLRDFVNRQIAWQDATAQYVYTTQLSGCSFLIRKTQGKLQFAHIQPAPNMEGKLWEKLTRAFAQEIRDNEMWIYGANEDMSIMTYQKDKMMVTSNIFGGIGLDGNYVIYAQLVGGSNNVERVDQIYPVWHKGV